MSLIDCILFLRCFFLLASGAILCVYAIPDLNHRFLIYGARGSGSRNTGENDAVTHSHQFSRLSQLLNSLAAVRVSHSWFLHFYIVSVTSSMVWLHQILCKGRLVRLLAENTSCKTSVPYPQLMLCWLLMACQGSRRLYECLSLHQPSTSTMWIGHYAIGILFYIAMGISIWIEGSITSESSLVLTVQSTVSLVSMSNVFLILLFTLASIVQHQVHLHLGSLKKYTFPTHPAFSTIVTPHYLAECVIYLCLALLAAPDGQLVNKTVSAGLVFVLVNLGISADISLGWMREKFGADRVGGRWRMIPGVW